MFPTFFLPGYTPDAQLITLANPSAEQGLGTPGWTRIGTRVDAIIGRARPAASGEWIFWGGYGASATNAIYQTVSTAAYAVANGLIDSGTVNIEVTWWGGTYYQGIISDEPKFTAIFLDTDQVEISQSTAGYRDCTGGAAGPGFMRWLEFVETYDVPVGTRYIQFRFDFERNQGTNNDASVDDISVVFTFD